jgi:hypothetical protein
MKLTDKPEVRCHALGAAVFRVVAGLAWSLDIGTAAAAPPATVVDMAIPELSGCARSGLTGGRLWVHNDSGNPPLLFAIDTQGRVQQRVRVSGVDDTDWEDLASFQWQGQAYLAIADTGDNFAWREQVSVVVLAESARGASTATPVRVLRVRYPDGAHDVEALAVDPQAAEVLLLTKRRPPATLYRVALDGPDQQIATPVATLPDWWPERRTPVETIGARRYRGAVSAMDLSANGRQLAMLTSTHWMLFTRGAAENWAIALQRPPRIARLPRPRSGPDTIYEALCWADDGGLWISGERLPAPLIHIDASALR